MRLMLRWEMATTLPKAMVAKASTAMIFAQSSRSGPSAWTRMRIVAAKAATFGTTDM